MNARVGGRPMRRVKTEGRVGEGPAGKSLRSGRNKDREKNGDRATATRGEKRSIYAILLGNVSAKRLSEEEEDQGKITVKSGGRGW